MADSQPLRILLVGLGTSEVTFLKRLVEGLAGQGVHITISSSRQEVIKGFPQDKVDWLWAPNWHGPVILRLLRILFMAINAFPLKRRSWLKRLLRNEKSARDKLAAIYRYLPFARGHCDVIYFPWNSTAIGYIGLFDLGIPVVLSCRGSQVNIRPHLEGQERYVALLKQTFERAAAVHCVSEDILANAVALELNPDKAVVIRPAVDPTRFSPPIDYPQNDPIRLITTGSLIWRKGYEYLLMALRQLKDKGLTAELQIIGEGKDRDRIMFTSQDLGIFDQVILRGNLPPAEVINCLRQADIFVLSSLSEGISNAVLEAMSCGLPVVTTDCGGMREAIRDGVEGFVVPVRDPEALAEALQKLALDANLRKQMGQVGRERVIAQFDAQSQIESFITMFTKCQGQ